MTRITRFSRAAGPAGQTGRAGGPAGTAVAAGRAAAPEREGQLAGAAAVQVQDLTVAFSTPAGLLPAVSHVSLDLARGQITGLVGESGSGKSTLALTLLNAVPQPGQVTSGSVHIDGVGDVLGLHGPALRRARGARIGYVFQASQNSLNPLKQVGKQLLDLGRSHGERDLRGLLSKARRLLDDMGMDAERVLASFQHELSGGMRQRVGIVFALVLNAHVLILDEPTTALDMLTQASVMEIVRKVHAEHHLTTLIISHDVGVIGDLAHRMAVMYAGRIVEEGPTEAVLAGPRHPYTRGLLAAMPRITGDAGLATPLPGRPPDLASIPRQGCVFRDRCPLAMPECEQAEPPVTVTSDGRQFACYAAAGDAA
ncbi:MAG TPA: ABC transporter ATP-binding protein [Streptosporangiaceae bacterium]|nr:ABC transporter ATP-binding protein [Streptosporangiaceae bacterium]